MPDLVAPSVRIWSGAVALLALLAAGCGRPSPSDGAILVLVDTLRADRLGTYGAVRSAAPALDRRAARGVVFERALSTAPWTLPAVASVLTGRLPSGHGAGTREPRDPWWKRRGLASRVPTLAGRLAEAGLATAAFVNNPFLEPRFGLARGFEVYDAAETTNRASRSADATLEAALRWLDGQGDRRFFLFIHLFDPHMDYDPPATQRGRFTAGLEGKLPVRDAEGLRRRARELSPAQRVFIAAAYEEEVAGVDAALDRFFTALDTRGLWRRLLVLLTADHGEELFDHGGFEHGHTMFQELLHVPLILWAPGETPRRVATPVSLTDVFPSVLEGLGVPTPSLPTARSWWPLLRGGPWGRQRGLVAENTLYGPEQKAIVRWPYELIVDGRGRESLWKMAGAAGQQPASGSGPELGRRLRRELEAALAAAARAPRQASEGVAGSSLEELEALGYVE